MNPDAAMAFLDFVEARHDVWLARQAGQPQPWTDDPIVASRKFTNIFRLLDPGSQFVITDLLSDNPDPETFLARCFLYRHTNRPEAWRAYGSYPTLDNLGDLQEFWKDYKAGGGRVFSGAYMIYPQSSTPGTDKIDSIISLTRRLFVEEGLGARFLAAKSQAERFATLRSNKGVADFMSFQILTDYGYSTEFREDDFVVAGPGSRKGSLLLDPSSRPEETIRWAQKSLLQTDVYIPRSVRYVSLADCQNLMCEYFKYDRYTRKPLSTTAYVPAHPGPQPSPVIPGGWV